MITPSQKGASGKFRSG